MEHVDPGPGVNKTELDSDRDPDLHYNVPVTTVYSCDLGRKKSGQRRLITK